jgi:cobalt-zinc-cadmium efflux system outer membrane protein
MNKWIVLTAAAAAGCGGPPRPARPVSQLVAERTSFAIPDHPGPPAEVAVTVTGLLAKPLTPESAVRVALLNSPALAVQLESVGVASADYVTAAQVRNPEFYIAFRPPDRRPPSATDIEATLSEDVLDVLLLPLRKQLAQRTLDQSAIIAADAALGLVRDVRAGVYALQAQQQIVALEERRTRASDATADFARRLRAAGNISDLELATEDAEDAQARIDLLRAKSDLACDRETVNRLLGLTGPSATRWTLADALPTVPADDGSPDLAAATTRRLDVAAADAAVALADQAVSLTKAGLLTQVSLGADMERTTDKQVVVGPSIGLDVPIFNQHQGQIARAEAEARLARERATVARVNVEADVRAAAARVSAARAAADLATRSLVPQWETVTRSTQLQYNGMLVGPYQLLSAKRGELAARQSAVAAQLQYWIARADLDRAVGR